MSAEPAILTSCCPRCSGVCEAKRVTITLRRASSEFAILRSVPSDVCQVCGETQFSITTSLKMLAALHTTRPPDDVVLVPVYEFSVPV